MADVTTWEEGDVKCKVRLEGKKYKNAKKVEFVFQRKDNDKALGTQSADVKSPFLGTKTAECVWKAPKTEDTEICYVAKYHLKVDGKDEADIAQDIYVWAKDMSVDVKKSEDSTAFKGALVRFAQDVPQEVRKKLGNEGQGSVSALRRADDQGLARYQLQVPANVTTTMGRPYEAVGDWPTPTGRKRAVNAKLGLKAVIEWPVADVTSGEHEQLVNLDTDDAKPAHGPILKVKIGTADTAPGQAGDVVFVKAKFADDNTDRTPAAGEHGKGAEVSTTVKLDGQLKAVFELRLGPGGGEKVTISVGGTPAASDATVVVRNWRKLFYQLKGPDFMASTLPAKTLPDSTQGFDVAADSVAQIKKILDHTYTRFEVLKSFSHAANLYPTHQVVTSQYCGLPAGSSAFITTKLHYNADTPTAFAVPDSRTILIQMCTFASADEVAVKTVEKTATAAELVINAAADYGSYVHNPLHIDGDSAVDVTGCEWEADTTGLDAGTQENPGPDATHPGFDNFVPRKGAMSASWVTFQSMWKIKVTLPSGSATSPGSFAGAKSTTKCPIKIKFFLRVAARWIGGCASGNRQLLQVYPKAPKIVGQVMCHELGHSMGLTTLTGGNKAPPGITMPPNVDGGGNYYRNANTGEESGKNGLRTGGVGPHCAEAVPDKSIANYSALVTTATCVMFQANSATDDKCRDTYCATCIKVLKARNLKDVQTSFATRADADC